jgi:hypothetical protein
LLKSQGCRNCQCSLDGARFITYRVSDKNAPPGIEGITETSGGVYWITTTGGLYRFRADALSQPNKRSGAHPFLNTEFIDKGRGSVFEDRHNNLWYVADDLYRIRAQNGKVAFEKASLNLPANPNRPLTAFLMREAPDGSLSHPSFPAGKRRAKTSASLPADERIVADPEAPGFVDPLFGVINPDPRPG